MLGSIIIYGFAFPKYNISCRTLYQLSKLDHRYLLWDKSTIERYIKLLLDHQPSHILGLGIYTGKDQDKIRIETTINNKFRNKPINTSCPSTIKFQPFLNPINHSKICTGLGNSFCNLVSWHVVQAIQSGKLKSQYTFLHLPKKFDINQAVSKIQHMLQNLH